MTNDKIAISLVEIIPHDTEHILLSFFLKIKRERVNEFHIQYLHCVSKKGPTLKRYSSKLYGSIVMIFGRNIQKSLE